ncbi:MAG: ribonuclease HI family protein [Chloroherpetonaceae bacterium]|nr:ribonuclease HI family protein [Chthonomonadaceae bacterium]MDW8207134.1 ribonuclease HI family protein [Chloroherpetonaceae bacterium]
METITPWKAHVDGAARGNPGPAGIGIIIEDPAGAIRCEIGEPFGVTTNNVAEYSALIRALEEARALGCTRLEVYTDSELVAHQLNGRYAVKAAHLLPLYQRARQILAQFEHATVTHVPRQNNQRADALSNRGADLAEAGAHTE